MYNKIKDLKHIDETISDFLHMILNINDFKSNKEFKEPSEDWEEIEKYLYDDQMKIIEESLTSKVKNI
jgi:hypothetical protein